MQKSLFAPLALGLMFSGLSVSADEELIAQAESAAPAAISAEATIMLPDGTVLREGSNSWTCFPYFDEKDADPSCGDVHWTEATLAWTRDEEYTPSSAGVSYMLASDPPHLMILVPEAGAYEGFNETSGDGKTWLMWGDRAERHLMIPIEITEDAAVE